MLRSGLTERIRRGARCSYLEGTILAGAQDIRVHSISKTTKEPDVRRRGLRHITQIYATILTIAPRDLISRKRIYLSSSDRNSPLLHCRPTPDDTFVAHVELLVVVPVLPCRSTCSNQHVVESACSELKF